MWAALRLLWLNRTSMSIARPGRCVPVRVHVDVPAQGLGRWFARHGGEPSGADRQAGADVREFVTATLAQAWWTTGLGHLDTHTLHEHPSLCCLTRQTHSERCNTPRDSATHGFVHRGRGIFNDVQKPSGMCTAAGVLLFQGVAGAGPASSEASQRR